MNRRLDYTIASGMFRPPLDFILHNAGYTYVFQVENAIDDPEEREKLLSLPGIGKRSRQAIEWAMKDLKVG